MLAGLDQIAPIAQTGFAGLLALFMFLSWWNQREERRGRDAREVENDKFIQGLIKSSVETTTQLVRDNVSAISAFTEAMNDVLKLTADPQAAKTVTKINTRLDDLADELSRLAKKIEHDHEALMLQHKDIQEVQKGLEGKIG